MLAVVGGQAAAVLVHTPLVEAQHRSEFCALSADCKDFMFGSTGAPQFKYCIVLLRLPLQHKVLVSMGDLTRNIYSKTKT